MPRQCPKCELLFATSGELENHLAGDHERPDATGQGDVAPAAADDIGSDVGPAPGVDQAEEVEEVGPASTSEAQAKPSRRRFWFFGGRRQRPADD